MKKFDVRIFDVKLKKLFNICKKSNKNTNKFDENFKDLVNTILTNGIVKNDRTGVGTISYFGYQQRFNLLEGFPLLTLRKIHIQSFIHEMLWFMKSYDSYYDRFGNTNIKYLVDNNVTFWTDWCLKDYNLSNPNNILTQKEFEYKIKTDENFALQYGELGNIYGKQFNDFNGVNQIEEVLNDLKNNCDSRRMIVSAWNPSEFSQAKLPPCHILFQFYTNDINENDRINYSNENNINIEDCPKKYISLQLYMRSNDVYLGNPFNVAGYSLLLHMFGSILNYIPKDFILTIGDAHLYSNSIEAAKTVCSRESFNPCKIKVKKCNSIRDFRIDSFEIIDYKCHQNIKVDVAV